MTRAVHVVLAFLVAAACGVQAKRSNFPPATHVAEGAPTSTPSDELPGALTGEFADGQRNFATVKDQLMKRYVSQDLSEDDLYRAAIIGMLQYADPTRRDWNKLLSPAELADIQSDLQGQFTGVGIRIGTFDAATGYSTVLGTIPGSAAERAGIQGGDIIVTVDGTLFKGKKIHDVVHAVRGKVGETVTLSILRGDQLISVPIRRELVQYGSVHERVFSGGIGYVYIDNFSAKTADELAASLKTLSGQSVRGLIVDLRNNQGGDFEKAIACAEMLVPAGAAIASLTERGGHDKSFTAGANVTRVLSDVPVYVLANSKTSSGAELVTAALRDSRHAQLLGTHTYGKWSVQTIEDLANGYAIKYTTGTFQSPLHKSYEGTGLTPDVEVDMDGELVDKAMEESDPEKQLAIDTQLRTAVNLLGLRLQ